MVNIKNILKNFKLTSQESVQSVGVFLGQKGCQRIYTSGNDNVIHVFKWKYHKIEIKEAT